MSAAVIESERLRLRCWEPRDRAVLHAHCRDPEVMAYIGPVLDEQQADELLARQHRYLQEHGFCFWAVERKRDGALLGFCGLKPGAPDTPIADDVEIGWRFGREYWGRGYAREAAAASLAWGWRTLDAARIVAITVMQNQRSWRLMERLGMHRVAGGDFDHPAVPDGSPLKRAILYAIDRPDEIPR
ncbi:GNAT family N-acetyltransferase [Haliangium ochraceum]|uniref:GCN5-related N-acetyltransferase n=1 Tax=Haliangium ochraceum (strain DSM 14365 / JCM 11303 / SMP-2) TaxID=502025 RepID=D0LNI7_HALO1|nr:GNAT family N-acetyltransferase [Haliangium ochraceum]ACY16892.1 GCN5-related N-acetyltransferase [Haliangium ochraceum DSM 14365]